jgi:hypothetical protein
MDAVHAVGVISICSNGQGDVRSHLLTYANAADAQFR